MAQSNQWRLLPRVQSAPLIWVGDHDHGLLIYIFGNLGTSIDQYDSAVWGDDNVDSTSHITFFHQDAHYLVEQFNIINTIDAGNAILSLG
jgi:hypothetical protein